MLPACSCSEMNVAVLVWLGHAYGSSNECNSKMIIVCQMHLADYLITLVSVRVCVCLSTDRLSNDYVHNSLPIFTKFCMPLGNVVVSNAIVYLFLGQTGSRLPILEMCKIQFWQFRDCVGHIFPRIVTKT